MGFLGENPTLATRHADTMPMGVVFLGGVAIVSPSHVLSLAAPQSNKVPVVQHAHHMHPLTPLITYSNDHFSPGSPPGHLSPEIDPKTGEHGDRGDTASAKLGRVQLSKGTVTVSVPCWEWGALRWTVPLLAEWFSQPGPCVVGRGCSRWPGMGPHLVTALVGVHGYPARSPLWLS